MSNTPTDEEIDDFLDSPAGLTWVIADNRERYRLLVRAVLAKWGQQAQAVEPVADGLPLVIAGAIYDFAGFLTTRQKVIEVGSTANASPIADLVQEWAAKRNLSLENAAVLSWQELLAAPQPSQRG